MVERRPSAPISAAPSMVAAVPGVQPDAVALILEGFRAGVGEHLDVRLGLAGIEQDAVQIDTMDHDVGPLEALHERSAGRNAHDHAAVDGSTISTASGRNRLPPAPLR